MQATYPLLPILVVDDEAHALNSFETLLLAEGFTHVITCCDSREVLSILASQEIGILLLDLVMPHLTGEELLPQINAAYPDLPVIVVTASHEVETVVHCVKSGAFDYVVKPVDRVRLMATVTRALELQELRRENLLLKQHLLSFQLQNPVIFRKIITGNPQMFSIFQYVEAAAPSSQPVLITGETGVGKEAIAMAIHQVSPRRGKFVPVNVAGLDDNVFADTLFGHTRGAFTGAQASRPGLVEMAGAGTLLLDEVGDLSPASQVKLLRLLQEREYYPLGSDVPKVTDARVVVTTNKDIQALEKSGGFRTDLYYRLRGHHIHLPPLRDRTGDIPLLLAFFLEEAARSLGKKKPTPPPELFPLLTNYPFPGNVRELQAMVYDAVSRHKGKKLSMKAFKEAMGEKAFPSLAEAPAAALLPGKGPITFGPRLPTLKEAEARVIEEALARADGNQTLAAEMLGMTRQALNRRLRQEKPDK